MASAEKLAAPEIRIADRLNRISVSPTMAVLAAAEKLKAEGIDVADFGPGEPDFPTPDHIKRAAIKALDENRTKYTAAAGILPLRQAICDWHARELGSSYAPAECVVNVGGKHAIFQTICALINAGDQVVIGAPYWVSYPDMVKYAGGVPVFAESRAEDGFVLRAADLEKQITSKTRMVIVNSPSNPTGAVIPADEFQRILEVCKKHNVFLLSDECYSHFTYGEAKPYSIASAPDSKDTLIIAGSFSKTFAMTGWRLGYILGPKQLVDAIAKLQSQSTSNPTSIVQYAGLEAMRGSMESVGVMLAEYNRRREHIVRGLRTIPGVECNMPQGAFYVFPNVSSQLHASMPDSGSVARQLLEREHVAVTPGDAFGAPGHLRLSYATSMDRIDEGLKRLARFFGNRPS
jgi:aspartate aminotransferase